MKPANYKRNLVTKVCDVCSEQFAGYSHSATTCIKCKTTERFKKEGSFTGRTCQRMIPSGKRIFSEDRTCGKPVRWPNRFLCDECIKEAESDPQYLEALG